MAQPSKPGVHNGEVCIFKLLFLFNFSFLEFEVLYLLQETRLFTLIFLQGKQLAIELQAPWPRKEAIKTKRDLWTRPSWFAAATESEERFTKP